MWKKIGNPKIDLKNSAQEDLLKLAGKEGEKLTKAFGKNRKRGRLLKGLLGGIFLLVCLAGILFIYFAMYDRIPGKIFFIDGRERKLTLGVPMTGTVESVNVENGVSEIEVLNLAVENEFAAGGERDYSMQVKLFGIFPVKNVPIKVIEDRKVLPIGCPVGMYVDAKGVLVTQIGEFEGKDGNQYAPAKGILRKGDYILKINGEDVDSKEAFSQKVDVYGRNPLSLTVNRNGKELQFSLSAQENNQGERKLGIWIKDDIQGVGTVTYMNEAGEYGALGHGINDGDVGELFDLKDGSIYQTEIVDLEKSRPGTPGQMTGLIVYNRDLELGTLEKNCKKGVFGRCSEEGSLYLRRSAYQKEEEERWVSIGLRQEVRTGEAQIMCTVDEVPEIYQIEITSIHQDGNLSERDIEFVVTDPKLLDSTGGIVQGMSGSPILQNNRLIGAVTHVYVDDPTKGFGIFVEEMLEENTLAGLLQK